MRLNAQGERIVLDFHLRELREGAGFRSWDLVGGGAGERVLLRTIVRCGRRELGPGGVVGWLVLLGCGAVGVGCGVGVRGVGVKDGLGV